MPNIYYVSNSGNNANTGLSATTTGAFLTIAKAISVVFAGDTVRIAPGNYYEVFTSVTAGTLGNTITWFADKESNYFTDIKPGAVRITGCDSVTGNAISSNTIINCNGKGYQNFYNLVIDGTYSGTTSGVANTAAIINFYDCIINASGYGIYGTFNNVFCYRCLSTAKDCFYVCNCYSCVGFGNYSSFYSGNFYNCIAFGSYVGFYNNSTYAYNCTSFGCQYGYHTPHDAVNCKANNCQYGFYGNTSDLIKCKANNCQYGFYGSSLTDKLNVSDTKWSQCVSPYRGGGYDTGNYTQSKYEGYTDISKLLKIATAFKFDVAETGWSSDLDTLTASGATGSVIGSNTNYTNIGTYNNYPLYRSVHNDYLVFANNVTPSILAYYMQGNSGTTPNTNLTATTFCNNPSTFITGTTANLFGTYYGISTNYWTGTTNVSSSYLNFSENYDVLRHTRRMNTGILDCGAYEYSNVSLEWTTYKANAPAIKISRKGQKRIQIPMKANVPKNINMWVYYSGNTAPSFTVWSPQDIFLTATTTVTATNTGGTWESLRVIKTPKADGVAFISLNGNDTGSTAYAIFSDIFGVANVPTVTTNSISGILSTSASGSGYVVTDGGGTVTQRGICWSSGGTPTINNNKSIDGTGTGSFTCSLSGLSQNTTYYVRAFAINGVGTSYGDIVSFVTNSVAVNDIYAGGRVAYIFNSGDTFNTVTNIGYISGETHGIIDSMWEWGCKWCPHSDYFPGTQNTGIGWSLYNTIYVSGLTVGACDDARHYAVSGYTDWCIANSTECDYLNYSQVGVYYWTTHKDHTNLWLVLGVRQGDYNHSWMNQANNGMARMMRYF